MTDLNREVLVVSHAALMIVFLAASIAVGEKVKSDLDDNSRFTLVLLLFGFSVSIIWLVRSDWSTVAVYEPIVTTVATVVAIWELAIRPNQRRKEREEDAAEDAKQEKTRLLQVLDRDCSLNELVIKVTKLQSTRRINEAGTQLVDVPFEQLEFLRLSTTAIESVLQSGLFDSDSEFISKLEPAKLDFEQFNSRITVLQNSMKNAIAAQRTTEHEGFLRNPFLGRVEQFFNELHFAITSRREVGVTQI